MGRSGFRTDNESYERPRRWRYAEAGRHGGMWAWRNGNEYMDAGAGAFRGACAPYENGRREERVLPPPYRLDMAGETPTPRLDRGELLDVLGQPLPGDVQPPLDGADRRVEGIRHLDERLAPDVKRLESLPVEPAELG